MPEGTEELEVDDVDDVDDQELAPGTPPDDDDADDDADGDGTPPPEGGEPPEPGSKAWADLEKKYPGLDESELRQKVALSYWDQTKELSKVAKERRQLELRVARLEGRLEGSGPPPDEEPPAPPPEVQELDNHIHGLAKRDEDVSNEQIATLQALNEAKEKVAELKGMLKAAKESTDEDKANRLEGRIETAEARQEALRDKLQATVRERKDIAYQTGKAKQERSWFLRLAEQGQANEKREQTELQETLEGIPRIVNGLIKEVVETSGMPADPALREDLRDTLQNKITVDLWKAGKKMPFSKVDVPGLLKQHTERYMKAHGIAKRADFQRRSEERERIVAPSTPARQTPTETVKKVPVVSSIGALPAGMLRARRILSKSGW